MVGVDGKLADLPDGSDQQRQQLLTEGFRLMMTVESNLLKSQQLFGSTTGLPLEHSLIKKCIGFVKNFVQVFLVLFETLVEIF